MQIKIKSKENTKITDGMSSKIEEKVSKLERYFQNHDKLEANVLIEIHKGVQKIEVSIPVNKQCQLRAESKDANLYVAIDTVIDKLERQIRTYKTRLNKKTKRKPFVEAIEEISVKEKDTIAKEKTLYLTEMDEEEAIMQMELLDHDFYAFINDSTSEANIVYRRKNGTKGLLILK